MVVGKEELINRAVRQSFHLEGIELPDVVESQTILRNTYTKLLILSTSDEEKKLLRQAYEITRLKFINNEDVRQRDNMMLPKDK